MTSNKYLGIEQISCGDDDYTFKADFNFTAVLEQNVGDPLDIHEEFSLGKCSPKRIRDVLCCSIQTKNGEEIQNKEAEIEDLITRNGLQDCLYLSNLLLAYAVIGDVKKSELRKLKPNKLTELITEPFKLESSRDRRLLWGYHLIFSTVCLCANFSLLGLLFVYNTDFARMVLTLLR